MKRLTETGVESYVQETFSWLIVAIIIKEMSVWPERYCTKFKKVVLLYANYQYIVIYSFLNRNHKLANLLAIFNSSWIILEFFLIKKKVLLLCINKQSWDYYTRLLWHCTVYLFVYIIQNYAQQYITYLPLFNCTEISA